MAETCYGYEGDTYCEWCLPVPTDSPEAFDAGGEQDTPAHCSICHRPLDYELTRHGVDYVIEYLQEALDEKRWLNLEPYSVRSPDYYAGLPTWSVLLDWADHLEFYSMQSRDQEQILGRFRARFRRAYQMATGRKDRASADLGHRIWSARQEDWTDRGLDMLWDRMADAFDGTRGPIIVDSSPGSTDRFGYIEVSQSKAKGVMTIGWGDVERIANDLGLMDEPEYDLDDLQAFADSLPYSNMTAEPGVDAEVVVSASNFEDLMLQIDGVETSLADNSVMTWREIEAMYRPGEPTGSPPYLRTD